MSEPTPHVLTCPDAATARFELRCWGEFSLSDRVRGEDCTPRGRKARAIIAYLASHGGAVVSRERLAALLWSERGDPQARGSLRKTLGELRPYAEAAAGLLLIEHDHVRLHMSALTSDLAQLEAYARADDLAGVSLVLSEMGDRLFDGLDGLDPAFDEWLALERRVQEDRLLSLATATAERGLHRGEFASTARLATLLQARDETNEAIAQIGMKADHACGDRSGLRRRHHRLCEGLRQGMGVGPSPQSEALFRELEGDEKPAAPVAPATAAKVDPAPTMPGPVAQDEAAPQSARIADPAEPTPSSPRRRALALWTLRRRIVAAALLALLASAAGAAWLLRDNTVDALQERAARPARRRRVPADRHACRRRTGPWPGTVRQVHGHRAFRPLGRAQPVGRRRLCGSGPDHRGGPNRAAPPGAENRRKALPSARWRSGERCRTGLRL